MEANSETQAVTTRSTGIRYGIIMGTISIVYFLIFVITDMDMSKGIGRWGTIAYRHICHLFRSQIL